jgi:hypothetical protein
MKTHPPDFLAAMPLSHENIMRFFAVCQSSFAKFSVLHENGSGKRRKKGSKDGAFRVFFENVNFFRRRRFSSKSTVFFPRHRVY